MSTIVKFAGHADVDYILSRAIPNLVIISIPDRLLPTRNFFNPKWNKLKPNRLALDPGDSMGIGIAYNLQDQLNIDEVDLLISDEPAGHFLSRQLRPKRDLFFVHGMYDSIFETWYIRKFLNGVPYLSSSTSKNVNFSKKVKEPAQNFMFAPCIDPSIITSYDSYGNGRVVTVFNSITRKQGIYDEHEAKTVWNMVKSHFGDNLSLFGEGNTDQGPVAKGYTDNVTTTVSNFSVAIFPFMNRQLAYSELETMAAGVPCVFYKERELLRLEEDGRSFIVAEELYQVIRATEYLLTNDEFRKSMGVASKEYVRKYHNIDNEVEGIRVWLKETYPEIQF